MGENGMRPLGFAHLAQNWDSYRYFLTVARCGSLTAAARLLGESQPTVGRKVRDLETALETLLLERTAGGMELTAAGERILEHVERIELETRWIGDKMRGDDSRPEGSVVVTSPEGFGLTTLVPHLDRFHARYPEIDLELRLCTSKLKLTQREADIAVRIGDPLHHSLVGRRLGVVRFAFAASEGYLARRGTPGTLDDLAGHDLIDATQAHLLQAAFLRQCVPDARRVIRTDSLTAQMRAAECGLGVALLPCYLVRTSPRLRRILPDALTPVSDVWVLTRPDLRDLARVRVVAEFLTAIVRQALDREPLETGA
ncbi:MAG: LysR family transcriptional regulator [Pseudomonadota bacterium]